MPKPRSAKGLSGSYIKSMNVASLKSLAKDGGLNGYSKLKKAYRSFIALKVIRSDYENLKGDTLRLQALVRGEIVRGKVKRIKAARVFQCNWRQYLARDRFLRF